MYGIPRAKPARIPRAGGKITGPGTGTSDSIKAKVPAGSYIMPADSTEQLGFGAPRAGAGKVPVNVSSGETAILPEQVHAFGVRALNQLKNATHAPTGQPSAAGGELFFADGGLVEDPEKKWTPEQRAQKQDQLARQAQQLKLASGYDASPDIRNAQAADDAAMQTQATAGLQPTVKPGYSSFAPARDLQRAQDARMQSNAIAADKMGQTVSRAADGAVNAAMTAQTPQPARQAPSGAVTRGSNEFAPGLNIMQPARDAQNTREIRNVEQAAQMEQTVSNASQGAIDDALAGKAPAAGLPVRKEAPVPAQSVADSYARGLRGAGEVALGVAGYPGLAVYDGVRNVAGSLAGGDTGQIKQYRGEASNLVSGGVEQMSTASADLRERSAAATRDALGIQKAPATAATAPTGAAEPVGAGSQANDYAGPESAPAASSVPATGGAGGAGDAGGAPGWTKTGIGAGAQGGEIAMRRNEQGQVEFTNETASPEAVAGAQSMPAGGYGVPRRGAGGEDLAGRGSSANVGNGVGTFSQMEAGSSQEALARFERANQIRDEQLAESGGFGVAGLRDSSRMPSTAELVNNKLARQDKRDQAETVRTNQDAQLSASRVATEELQQQKLQQDLITGQYSLEDQQRMSELRSQLSDPNLLPEQRAQLEAAYYALNTSAKDRYMEVRGGTNADGAKDASRVFDQRTGRYVDDGAAPGAATASGETIAQPSSKAEYDALPKGAQYMKDGQIRIKS
jgi:hypothetical protein